MYEFVFGICCDFPPSAKRISGINSSVFRFCAFIFMSVLPLMQPPSMYTGAEPVLPLSAAFQFVSSKLIFPCSFSA